MNETVSRVEYLTILAPTAALAMDQFSQQGLAGLGYAIVGRIGRHRVSIVLDEGPVQLLPGDEMVAATFCRTIGEPADRDSNRGGREC